MNKKAIAYTHDVLIGRTKEMISRAVQREIVREYAAHNHIEIVDWVEDEIYEETPLKRPGVKQLLLKSGDCDCVLVERVWCLSRSWGALRPLVDELEDRGMHLESASWAWDCVSVIARHYCRQKERAGKVKLSEVQERAVLQMLPRPAVHKHGLAPQSRRRKRREYAIQKPDVLHFEHMFKRHG